MLGKRRSVNGWTLVETMVVIAIVGIVFVVGPNLMMNMTRYSKMSTARLETQRNARESLNLINTAMRQASATTIVVSQESGQPPYSSVSFSAVDGRWLKFYQQGDDLNFVQGSSTKTVCDGLRFISFAYPRTDDDAIMSVSVTFEKQTYQGGLKTLQMAIEKVRIMND